MPDKKSADDILKYFSYFFFLENKLWHFMQIVSSGENLHEMSSLFSEKNKKTIISLTSVEFAQRVVKIKKSSDVSC